MRESNADFVSPSISYLLRRWEARKQSARVHMPVAALGLLSRVAVLSPPPLWRSMNPSYLRYAILRGNEITLKTAPRKALIIKNMTAAIRELICFLFSFFETGSHVTQESFEFSVQERRP